MKRWTPSVDIAAYVRGSTAEDKDVARDIRRNVILPTMAGSQRIRLDFTGIKRATQSFVDACISEAIRKYGRDAVKRIELHGCAASVRSVIETVVSYSLDFSREKAAPALMTCDVPQADDLSTIRTVVEAAAAGASNAQTIERRTKFSARHVAYRVNAARVLGLLSPAPVLTPTDNGLKLLEIPAGCSEEALHFRRCIEQSAAFSSAVPDLFEEPPPSRAVIADRLRKVSGLTRATASRRAQTLVSWRRQVLQEHGQ